MDAKYDKFKKLMSEDKEALPPELGWEHMEAGILKKMEEIQSQADTSTPSKKTDYLRRGFILSILLMLAFCNHNSTNTYPTKTVAVSPQTISNTPSDVFENSIVNTISTSSASSKEKLDNAFSSTENKPLEGISGAGDYSGMTQNLVNPLPKTVSPTKRSENVKIEGSNAKRLDSSNSSDSLPTDFRGEASPILDIGKSQSEEKVQKEGEEGLEKSANQVLNSGPVSEGQAPSTSHWTIAPLSTKEFLLNEASEILRLPAFAQANQNNGPIREESQKAPQRWSVLSGVSFWNNGSGENKPERFVYEQTGISFNAQFNYLHPLKKDYVLLVGVQYLQLEHQFDWTGTINDYKITLADTIVELQVSSLTGQQTPVYGDVELEVEATRTIQHHNRIQLIQLPVAIGKTWIFRKWQADLLIGGSVNILTQNKGRTFYRGELQSYDGPGTAFLENQWKINGQFMGRLAYKLNQNLGLVAGVQFQKSLTNWSKEPALKMNPNVFSLEVGVNYYLSPKN
jgi:hypothetical protein